MKEKSPRSFAFLRSSEVSPNTKWTIEIMAGAIYALKESNKPVNSRYLQANHPNLYARIKDYPGGWRAVIEFAGFNPEEEKADNLGRLGRTPVFDNDY